MADDGLEFAQDDTDLIAKINRKTDFIGTGDQIDDIVNTYPGMGVYCTVTGSGFTTDNGYIRNAANSAWIGGFDMTLGNLSADIIIIDDTLPGPFFGLSFGQIYRFFTMPSTHKFFIVTKIKVWNRTLNTGSIMAGVDVMDASAPASSDPTINVGRTLNEPLGAVGAQELEFYCDPIKAGTRVGVWVEPNGTGTIDNDPGGSTKAEKVKGFNIDKITQDVTVFTNTFTTQVRVVITIRGISPLAEVI